MTSYSHADILTENHPHQVMIPAVAPQSKSRPVFLYPLMCRKGWKLYYYFVYFLAKRERIGVILEWPGFLSLSRLLSPKQVVQFPFTHSLINPKIARAQSQTSVDSRFSFWESCQSPIERIILYWQRITPSQLSTFRSTSVRPFCRTTTMSSSPHLEVFNSILSAPSQVFIPRRRSRERSFSQIRKKLAHSLSILPVLLPRSHSLKGHSPSPGESQALPANGVTPSW